MLKKYFVTAVTDQKEGKMGVRTNKFTKRGKMGVRMNKFTKRGKMGVRMNKKAKCISARMLRAKK